MGAMESSAGTPYGGAAVLEGGMQKDEFRRGDRVLVLSRLEDLDDPELIEKLQLQRKHLMERGTTGAGYSPRIDISGHQDQVESSTVVDVAGAGDSPARQSQVNANNQLPDYPRSCYGWIVLAVDYQAGIYAIQMADGSYLPEVAANAKDAESTDVRDFALLIRGDWPVGGVDASKNPEMVPASSTDGGLDSRHQSPKPEFSMNGPGEEDEEERNANKIKKKASMKCGARVTAQTKLCKHTGIIACVNADKTFNVQTDFGEYLHGVTLDHLECRENVE